MERGCYRTTEKVYEEDASEVQRDEMMPPFSLCGHEFNWRTRHPLTILCE